MRGRVKVAAGALLIGVLVAAGLLLRTLRYGFSAQDEPTAIEHRLARVMRHYAVPSELRERKNPVPLTPEVLEEAKAHFADHCASCHGNDGKGQTTLGRNLYPKAPDMTLAETQSLSDGELFATIENGIRLTGMPGWGTGTAESAHDSWTLVHFIRHVPRISPRELAEMERLNPKSMAEWDSAKEAEGFLKGGEERTSSPEARPGSGAHHH